MTRSQLLAEIYRQVEEDAASPVFFSATDVETALDDAYDEMADETEFYETSVRIDLLASRPYYDLRTVISETVLSVGPAFNRTTNRWLIPSTDRDLDLGWRRWEQVSGEPERLFTHGLWWLGLWPITSSASGVIDQYYTALPPAMSEATHTPAFPEQFQWGLVEHAVSELWPQRGDGARGLAAWERYLGFEQGLATWVKGRGSMAAERRWG